MNATTIFRLQRSGFLLFHTRFWTICPRGPYRTSGLQATLRQFSFSSQRAKREAVYFANTPDPITGKQDAALQEPQSSANRKRRMRLPVKLQQAEANRRRRFSDPDWNPGLCHDQQLLYAC